MKIHIAFDFKENTGGGAHFLKLLRREFAKLGSYSEDPRYADIILFNSHQNPEIILNLKKIFPDKLFVHRIDGPMKLYNTKNDVRDEIVHLLNRLVAEATIFQSQWSKKTNCQMGFKPNGRLAVILNAPDSLLFKKELRSSKSSNLILSYSWSQNPNKGLHYYEWMDKNLDFSKYRMIFIGNIGYNFRNIEHRPAMSHEDLVSYLRECALFFFPSRYESCSNALLEALHCGTPVLALKSSSNTEIVGSEELLFSECEEIEQKINYIMTNKVILPSLPSIHDVVESYTDFFNILITKSDIPTKKLSALQLKLSIFKLKSLFLKGRMVAKWNN